MKRLRYSFRIDWAYYEPEGAASNNRITQIVGSGRGSYWNTITGLGNNEITKRIKVSEHLAKVLTGRPPDILPVSSFTFYFIRFLLCLHNLSADGPDVWLSWFSSVCRYVLVMSSCKWDVYCAHSKPKSMAEFNRNSSEILSDLQTI